MDPIHSCERKSTEWIHAVCGGPTAHSAAQNLRMRTEAGLFRKSALLSISILSDPLI